MTCALRKCNCLPINLNNNSIPQMESTKSLGLHFGRTLIWDTYIVI